MIFDNFNFVCIDTGSNGGICSVQTGEWIPEPIIRLGKLDCANDEKCFETMRSYLLRTSTGHWDAHEVIVERPPYFMGTMIPSSRIAVLFECYGKVVGFLNGLGIKPRLVDARIWQEPMRDALGYKRGKMKHADWKRALTQYAKVHYPNLDGLTGQTADALLLARWRLLQRAKDFPPK